MSLKTDTTATTNIKSCDDFEFKLWKLPDVILYQVVSFVAAPTHRAHVLCHQIAPLCRDAYHSILESNARSTTVGSNTSAQAWMQMPEECMCQKVL